MNVEIFRGQILPDCFDGSNEEHTRLLDEMTHNMDEVKYNVPLETAKLIVCLRSMSRKGVLNRMEMAKKALRDWSVEWKNGGLV